MAARGPERWSSTAHPMAPFAGPGGCDGPGGAEELAAALSDIAALAVEGVHGCAQAGVTWSGQGRPRTLAATGAQARAVDDAQYREGDGPCLAALSTDEVVACEDFGREERWPAVAAAARSVGLVSSLSMPLNDGTGAVGALNLYATSAHAFDIRARRTAQALARQGSITLAHLARNRRERAEHALEHRIAETLQRSLLPPLPALDGLACAARYLPATTGGQVGGDWYNLFALPGQAIGLAIGDVSGHDTAAAAAMGQLRSVVRSYAYEGNEPATVLERLDRFVAGFDLQQLASVLYARLTWTGRGMGITYSNAGHPPALLRTPNGHVHALEGGSAALIGLPATVQRPRPQARAVLPVGSTLLLCTDGLLEARRNGRHRDLAEATDQLVDLVAGGDHTDPERLCDRILAAMLTEEPEDDVALLALHITGRAAAVRCPPDGVGAEGAEPMPRSAPGEGSTPDPAGEGRAAPATAQPLAAARARALAHLLASAERDSEALRQDLERGHPAAAVGAVAGAARRCSALIQDALLFGATELASALGAPDDALPQ